MDQIGLHQDQKSLCFKGYQQESEETTDNIGENICKLYKQQELNFQNLQTAHATQKQQQKKTQSERELLLLLLLSRFSRVRLCATPETAAHQAPLSLGFARQEHWSGLPFPSPMHESESEVAQSCLIPSGCKVIFLCGFDLHFPGG